MLITCAAIPRHACLYLTYEKLKQILSIRFLLPLFKTDQ
ncbi:hypothetical protein GT23_3539 [Parageobacillus thermoglucosidasius]|nr:hypothetical protein GT23_3539 [Parageobacillus thermoglucosidasius]